MNSATPHAPRFSCSGRSSSNRPQRSWPVHFTLRARTKIGPIAHRTYPIRSFHFKKNNQLSPHRGARCRCLRCSRCSRSQGGPFPRRCPGARPDARLLQCVSEFEFAGWTRRDKDKKIDKSICIIVNQLFFLLLLRPRLAHDLEHRTSTAASTAHQKKKKKKQKTSSPLTPL